MRKKTVVGRHCAALRPRAGCDARASERAVRAGRERRAPSLRDRSRHIPTHNTARRPRRRAHAAGSFRPPVGDVARARAAAPSMVGSLQVHLTLTVQDHAHCLTHSHHTPLGCRSDRDRLYEDSETTTVDYRRPESGKSGFLSDCLSVRSPVSDWFCFCKRQYFQQNKERGLRGGIEIEKRRKLKAGVKLRRTRPRGL